MKRSSGSPIYYEVSSVISTLFGGFDKSTGQRNSCRSKLNHKETLYFIYKTFKTFSDQDETLYVWKSQHETPLESYLDLS